MIRLLREPLLHFLVLGALMFIIYGRWNQGEAAIEEIVVTRGQQEHLIGIFSRTWQRDPTDAELEALIQDYLREEIAYREGLAMGLNENDTIVRRRMRQKLELLSADRAESTPPTDAELEATLNEHADRFEAPPRLDLRQVYLNTERRGARAQADAIRLLSELAAHPDSDLSEMGDSLALPLQYDNASTAELDRLFGSGFSQSLLALEPGVWSGPIRSGYGLHLVRVDNLRPARLPELDEIRARVTAEWMEMRRRETLDELYARLTEKYAITIEPLNGKSE